MERNKMSCHKLFRRPVIVLLSIFFVVGVCAGIARADKNKPWFESNSSKPLIELRLPSFAPVIEKLGKSVVNISSEGKEMMSSFYHRRGRRFGLPKKQQESPPSPFDFFFQFPPNSQGRPSMKTHSLGSGFVIHPDGLIVTNGHVVANATKILVAFQDSKKPYRGEIVGKDEKTDIALIKIKPEEKLTAVVLGDSDALRPGDWVIAIGNPFRLGHSVTVGVVSAKSRKVPGGGPYDDFIQTDASINPGNSGGPLFNAKGEVVGINTAIYSPGSMGGSTGFNIGIGFATPINLGKSIIAQLYEHGSVVRGWLGVLIQPVTQDFVEAMDLTTDQGALVAQVLSDSPAKAGGLQRGDIIVEYDGDEVVKNDDLPLMVAETPVGKTVDVVVLRSGKKKTLKVKIEQLKEQKTKAEFSDEQENRLGLSLQDITPDIAKSLGLEEPEGVVVTNVLRDSAAQEAGLQRGDIILEVGSKAVNSTKEFGKATKDLEKDKPLLLLVRRGENTIFLTLKLE